MITTFRGITQDTNCLCYQRGKPACGYPQWCSCAPKVGLAQGVGAGSIMLSSACQSATCLPRLTTPMPMTAPGVPAPTPAPAAALTPLQALEAEQPERALRLQKLGYSRTSTYYYNALKGDR